MERWILVILVGLTLNQVLRTQQDVMGQEPGSGGGDDDASGADGEGSAGDSSDLTPCERQQASTSNMPGAFSPRCTQDGEFEPMQCKSRECWCVDKEGKEKSGSRQSSPNSPRCTGRTEFVAPTRKPPGALPGDWMDTRSTVDGDDIVYEESSTAKLFTPGKPTEHKASKIQTTTSTFQGYDHSDDNVDVQKPSMFAFIFKDPLILAGIVGGAVLALLCIVLLIMFTIYRMRKKDEGSYALDEPKKSYGFAYTRARDQEFFA